MIRDVVFRPFSNEFQNKLKGDLNNIINSADIILAADKTTNHYDINTNDAEDMVQRYIQKDYKKVDNNTVANDISAQKEVVKDFELETRVMYTAPVPAYVTLKDHKPNFNNNPTCRLINPSKIEIGKISKQILSRVVNEVRDKTQLTLWKNTDSVIKWFESLERKDSLQFIQFDICDYYGSISKELFQEAVNWAKNYSEISEKEENVIFQAKASLLSDGETGKGRDMMTSI